MPINKVPERPMLFSITQKILNHYNVVQSSIDWAYKIPTFLRTYKLSKNIHNKKLMILVGIVVIPSFHYSWAKELLIQMFIWKRLCLVLLLLWVKYRFLVSECVMVWRWLRGRCYEEGNVKGLRYDLSGCT